MTVANSLGPGETGTWVSLPGYFPWGYYTNVTTPGTAAPSAASISASTGVNPVETSYSLYGHTIPLLVIGKARIGSEIISGPWIENRLCSAIFSCGVEADPTRTRTLVELAFDSEVVWTGSLAGGGTPSAAGFSTEPFTFRFIEGNLTQAADALETLHFGAEANAYRPQILIAIENLPLANTKFRKTPYVSGVILDQDGEAINFGEAFERLAASPWVNFPNFETSGLTDGVPNGGLIFAQDAEFLQSMKQFGRFYPSWDILQTDKLRIVDRGSDLTADITLDKTRLMGKVVISRAEPNSVPSILELSTIDPDADYTIVPSRSQRPRAPVAVTTAVRTESSYLPVIMDSATRIVVVTFAKYAEEQARKRISFTAMAYGLEIEPGDLVDLDLGSDFREDTWKVKETTTGVNNVVECIGESILKCYATITGDPHIGNVVLLLGYNGVDGSTGDPGMTDESPADNGTGTAHGNAQIDTAQKKFGTASYLGDGTGDGLQFPPDDQADWQIAPSSGDQFTVEAWVRPATTSQTNKVIVGQGGVAGTNAWLFWCNTTGNGELSFWGATSTNNFNWPRAESSGITWTSGQWYHVAADRDASNTLRIYRDGVMLDSISTGSVGMSDASSNGAVLGVGCDSNPTISRSWNGWIDEVRITKGYARYASDSGFTVPAAAFPRT